MEHIRRHFIIALLLIFLLPLSAYAFDRQAAVLYADKYSDNDITDHSEYNPFFNAYPYDCTNFLSQCLIAANIGFGSTTGYRDNKGCMTRVDEIGPELQINHGVTATHDYTNPQLPLYLLKGDPVFLLHNSIFDEDKVHAMIVTGVDNSFLVYDAHSNDRNHEPFKNINLLGGWFLRHFKMPNAPIIKYVKLTQVQNGVEKIIYQYTYDDDYNPAVVDYYANAYNGLAPVRDNPNAAISGEIRLKIIFDTTMQPNVSISCGLNSPYSDYAFSMTKWSATHQASDTWEGKVTIPSNAISGEYKISVNGYAPDGSQIDSNGNLTTYNPGPDLVHKFFLNPFKVTVIPPVLHLPPGNEGSHTLKIENLTSVTETFSVTVTTGSTPGWTVGTPTPSSIAVAGNSVGNVTFTVKNNNAVGSISILAKVKAMTWNFTKTPENLDSSANGHINDHPDETYEVSSPNYPTVWKYDSESNIGLFVNGWGEGLGYLLGKYDIATCVVKEDLTILNEPEKTLNDLKVLFIGSAGLTGLDNSATFKQKLADHVSQGGTIICLTQQHGYEFNALPGGQVSGYGWSEDESCWSNAVGIGAVSAVFNGQTKAQLDANVDGYLTTWPANSKLLLNRTKNNMPAMLEYTYGQGRVIVSTLYTDWSYGHGQTSTAEQTLIKQLVNYALDPNIALTQNLISIPPSADFSFGVTTDSEQYAYNQPAVFTIHVWNHTNQERTISYNYNYSSGGSSTGAIIVPANGEGTAIKVENINAARTFASIQFKDEQGEVIGSIRSSLVTTYNPSVKATIKTDKPQYGAGESLLAEVSLTNNATASYDSDLAIYILDTTNTKIAEYHEAITLSAGQTITKGVNFNLPSSLFMGSYIVKAECLTGNQKIGEGVTTFEIPKPAL